MKRIFSILIILFGCVDIMFGQDTIIFDKTHYACAIDGPFIENTPATKASSRVGDVVREILNETGLFPTAYKVFASTLPSVKAQASNYKGEFIITYNQKYLDSIFFKFK